MKILFALTILIFTMTQVNAQTKNNLTGGLRGSFNSTWLLNKDISDAAGLDYIVSYGNKVGGGIGFYFLDNLGVTMDFMLNNHVQKYGNDKTGSDWVRDYRLKYIEINILLRFITTMGFFLEGGPEVLLLKSAKQSGRRFYASLNDYVEETYLTEDITNSFEKINIAYLFGFGSEFDISESFYILAGLRFYYFNKDVIVHNQKSPELIYYPYDAKTQAIAGGFQLGVFYRLEM